MIDLWVRTAGMATYPTLTEAETLVLPTCEGSASCRRLKAPTVSSSPSSTCRAISSS
jgi:hypothetical protein